MPRLFKRGSIYFVQYKDSRGRWVRKTTNCEDKATAIKVAAALERDSFAGPTTTIKKACESYILSRRARGRSPETERFYRVKMGHLIRLLPADLRQIGHSVLEAYLSQRIDEGAAKTTVKKEFRALTSVLRHAARNGTYAGDPRNIVPELEDDYQPRTRFLTLPEADKLLRALPVDRAAQAAFILATGARWSEAVKARPMDVQTGVVHLRGTKTEGANREVPIVTSWQVQLLATATGYMPFRAWSNSRRDLGEACKAAGINPVSANDLRRTFATWMRHLGVDIGVIAKLLGHTSTRMAERVYARLTTESVADAIRKTTGTIVGQATDNLNGKHAELTFKTGDQKR